MGYLDLNKLGDQMGIQTGFSANNLTKNGGEVEVSLKINGVTSKFKGGSESEATAKAEEYLNTNYKPYLDNAKSQLKR